MEQATNQADARRIPGHMRKPAIALMGEFSAGKSTLTNLLIGARALPVQVTATQLPPVWIAYGSEKPYREDINGERHPVDLERLEEIDLDETRAIRIFRKAEILTRCDLIDMPGISDPNMSSDVWQRVLPDADGVIWCTHATQAWRQSESAVWEMMPDDIHTRSILLLTRFDKITEPDDRRRVLRRVQRETDGLFIDLFPISLIDALAAGDNHDAWVRSGAESFVKALIGLLENAAGNLGSRVERRKSVAIKPVGEDVVSARFRAHEEERIANLPPEPVTPRRIAPARPAMAGNIRRPRPEGSARIAE